MTRARLASRFADLETEAEKVEFERTLTASPRLSSRLADLRAESQRVRTELNEMDIIVSQTETAMFRILSPVLGASATSPTDAEIEAALRRDAQRDPAPQPAPIPQTTSAPQPAPPSKAAQPPARAQAFLRLLLDARDQKVIVGDLIERYEVKVNKRGKRRADLWFYYEVARSSWPFIRRMIARAGGRISRARRAD